MRECSKHRRILVRTVLPNGTPFLKCPVPGCTYCKPIKNGPRIPKRGMNVKQTNKG